MHIAGDEPNRVIEFMSHPATSCPRETIFADWTRTPCASLILDVRTAQLLYFILEGLASLSNVARHLVERMNRYSIS